MKEKRPQLTRQVRDEYGNTLYIIAIQLQFYNIKKFITERTANTVFLYNDYEVLYTNFKINSEWDFLFEHLYNNSYMSFSDIINKGIKDYIVTYNKIYQMDTGKYFAILSVMDHKEIISQIDEENLKGFVIMFAGIAISLVLIGIFSGIYGKRMVLFSKQMHMVAIGEYDKVTPVRGGMR